MNPPRLLMCPPDFFNVTYEINAWMKIENAPDRSRAADQWNALHRVLTEDVGAEVHLLTPQKEWPDMVFTANAGITQGTMFVPSRFRHAERQGEVPFLQPVVRGARLHGAGNCRRNRQAHLRGKGTLSFTGTRSWRDTECDRTPPYTVRWRRL